jgi:hypothetical protein
MPLLRINVCGTQIVDPDVLLGTLRRTLAGLPADSPIIFLTHGYKFSPSYAHRSPHRHILSLSRQTSDAKMVSWPRKLGVGAETGGPEPLCIALGWEARGTFWHAYRNARNAGRAMAGLIKLLRRLRPGRPVDVLAHSLGARVTLSALPLLAPGDIGRAILLAPAELQSRAMRCLNTPAGRRAEFLSVTSGENLIFDKLLEWSVGPHLFGDRAMGKIAGGARSGHDNWTTLRIDDAATLASLRQFGYPTAPPDRRICHWSVYRRKGLFPLYRDLFQRDVHLNSLTAALPVPIPAHRPIWPTWFSRPLAVLKSTRSQI